MIFLYPLFFNFVCGSSQLRQGGIAEQVFIIERLRQQALTGRLDTEVLVGWNARDSILVGD